MGTPAIVALARPDGGWDGTYVGYDGVPERLGRALLDLVLAHGGDLEAAFRFVAAAPDGWRFAFSEPYEAGANREWFQTGREGPPLLRDTDAFVRAHVAYWYVFAAAPRALVIHGFDPESAETPWREIERVSFDDRGVAQFTAPAPHPLHWKNRRRDYGSGAPEATAARLLALLDHNLPLSGARVMLAPCTTSYEWPDPDGPPVLTDVPPASLTSAGLVTPLTVFLTDRPDAAGSWDPPPPISDLVQSTSFVLLPTRVLADQDRCESFVLSALGGIEAALEEGKTLLVRSPSALPVLFPSHLLDLELDDDALTRAVWEEVASAFGDEPEAAPAP